MGGVAPPPEHRVRCFTPRADAVGNEQLRFEIDGKEKGVTLQIGRLSKSLVLSLPGRAIDLIEIAAFVYAVDASVPRGGPTDPNLAAMWYRRFVIKVPVRDYDFWSDPDVVEALQATLEFLSGDRFEFTFSRFEKQISGPGRYFDFGKEGAWAPDTVMLFSGGLDSFAGALEEIVERKNKVALISHFSSTKISPIQRDLQKAVADKFGSEMLMHFPMKVQLKSGTNTEGTHRTRSFLFAALGMVTAMAFGKNRLAFYENGVVSLNLPPVGNVLGTRATRTTHPQTLSRFSGLFSRIFEKPLRAENPYFWKTKTDVVQIIARLEMGNQIAHTRSCADVHNQTKQYPHCGRCSQCIDRRFAILAAGLEALDPEEAYRIDLMTGVRTAVQDKEAALSYVRNAFGYDVMTPVELERRFPEVLRAVDYLNEPSEMVLALITRLLRHHGQSVAGVMREAMARQQPDQFPKDSLPYLFGGWQRSQVLAHLADPARERSERIEPSVLQLVFNRKGGSLVIDNQIEINGKTYDLLLILGEENLRGAGQGLDPLEYPTLTATKLSTLVGVASEETVRRRIMRARSLLGQMFASAGLDTDRGKELIENLSGSGYRLAPDRVAVRMRSDT